jgi:hypothetical protein
MGSKASIARGRGPKNALVGETVEERIERVFREVTPITRAITKAIRQAVRRQGLTPPRLRSAKRAK